MKRDLFQHYDFIILGEHLSALWGACLLLEKEFKVLVIPFGDQPGKNLAPAFALTPLALPPGVFSDRDQDPIQILTQGKRFRLFADSERLRDEYFFVFGREPEAPGPPDAQLFRGLDFLYRGAETGSLSGEDWKVALKNAGHTIYFNQSLGWLKKQFLDKIQERGGHVLTRERVQRIFVEKKMFVGVQLEGSSSMLLGSQVLIGNHWDQVQALCSEKTNVRSSPVSWSFDVQVQIDEDTVPAGMTTHMVYLQEDAPIVEILSPVPGTIILRAPLPYQDRFLDRVEQRKIAQRLFKLLGTLIPDLEYNLKRITPDIRDPERMEREDLPRIYPFHSLEDVPPSLLRYAPPGLGAQSPIQNMWFAYDEAFPQAGEWGAYRAVFEAIQAWGKQTQKPDPLRFNAPF